MVAKDSYMKQKEITIQADKKSIVNNQESIQWF